MKEKPQHSLYGYFLAFLAFLAFLCILVFSYKVSVRTEEKKADGETVTTIEVKPARDGNFSNDAFSQEEGETKAGLGTE